MIRAADGLVDILKSEGVKFVSTRPGDDILPIFDALHQNGEIPLIAFIEIRLRFSRARLAF